MTCPRMLARPPAQSLVPSVLKADSTACATCFPATLPPLQPATPAQVVKHSTSPPPILPNVKTTKWHQLHHLNLHLIRWRAGCVVASRWLDLEIERHYRRQRLDNDLSAVSPSFLFRKWFVLMGQTFNWPGGFRRHAVPFRRSDRCGSDPVNTHCTPHGEPSCTRRTRWQHNTDYIHG